MSAEDVSLHHFLETQNQPSFTGWVGPFFSVQCENNTSVSWWCLVENLGCCDNWWGSSPQPQSHFAVFVNITNTGSECGGWIIKHTHEIWRCNLAALTNLCSPVCLRVSLRLPHQEGHMTNKKVTSPIIKIGEFSLIFLHRDLCLLLPLKLVGSASINSHSAAL